MGREKGLKKIIGGSAAAIVFFITAPAAMSAQVTGAIFTTLIDGTAVNHNIYDVKEDVYLNGGPQPNTPCTAAGLPNGDYYFQVTDPAGKVLLSSDPVEARKVGVSGGVFVSLGSGIPGTHYSPQLDDTLPFGQCHGITVQLAPFDGSPNMGGEYKVWITKVFDYKPGYGSFGFIPSKSKTDNFKVPKIDTDGDGTPDADDACPLDPTDSCVSLPPPG
jgi:hypothetical protein